MKTQKLQKRLWSITALILVLAMMVAPAGAAPVQQSSDLFATGLEANATPYALGIDDPNPMLSWRLETSTLQSVMQTAFRVLVASDPDLLAASVGDVWDSGTVETSDPFILYGGPALTSRTRYYWGVKVWASSASGNVETALSTSWFETGYMNQDEWQGSWISGPTRPTAPLTTAQGTADDIGLVQPNTILVAVASPGDTNIKVLTTNYVATGMTLTIDSGDLQESVTVTSVGTGATNTTLAAPAAVGDANINVNSVSGFVVGGPLTVDIGGNLEAATITAVGTAIQTNRTLSAPVAAGATNIKVNNVGGFVVGQKMSVDTGANLEIRTVTAVGTSGASGSGITFTPALSLSHAQGASARGLGSGISFTPALSLEHAIGVVVIGSPGTGFGISPLNNSHNVGAAVVGPEPVDFCRPVGSSQNSGSCKPIRPTYLLRKAFAVAPVSEHGEVVSARLYASGLGWSILTVNGAKPQPNAFLNPAFTSYDQTVLYTTDDVTGLIQQDATSPTTNVVAAELAPGRYDSESRPSNHGWETAQWRAQEVLRADLYVKYADGTEQLVKSDDTWQVSIDGPTRYADYDDGETFDARKQIPGWDTPGYDASAWAAASLLPGPTGKVIAQRVEHTANVGDIPNTVDGVDTFPMWSPSPGTYAWDTLKQRTGWATVSIWGATAGQVIRVVYVERRNNDPSIPGPQDGALQLPGNLNQQYYISDGTGTEENPEVFAPKFNFGGFQWVLVSGSAGAALPSNVHVHVESMQEVRTNLPETGTFNSSNALLNKIYAAVKGSVAGVHVSGQMMDTPTYEKDGWTGDTQLVAPTASYIFDTQRQYRKSAQDAVDSQAIGDAMGGVKGQVGLLIPSSYRYGYCSPTTNPYGCGSSPSVTVFKGTNAGITPIWDAFIAVLPWTAYEFYGDTMPIETAYDTMVSYLDNWAPLWMAAYKANIDSTKNYLVNSSLGDWAFVTGAEGNAAEGTNVNVGGIQAPSSSAYLAYMAKITANAARVLGKTDDAARFDALFENIKADFNAKWWDESVGYYRTGPTQIFTHGMNAIPLGIGLVPDDKRADLQAKLVYDVMVTRTGHQMVGIASSRWIYDVLVDAAIEGIPGAAEATYAMALQTTYPSYGYWVETLGWTGLGEYWESTSRTRDHEMYGSIGQWMYQDLAGIQAVEPGFKTIRIRPLVVAGAGLDWVEASYASVRGTIVSSWEQAGGQLHLAVTIPPNTTAEVWVPMYGGGYRTLTKGPVFLRQEAGYAVFAVGSGTYDFVSGNLAWEGYGTFMPPVVEGDWNTVKAVQTVPVKFSLGEYYGLDILQAGYPRSVRVDCTTLAPIGEPEQTQSDFGLVWAEDKYQYDWKTDKKWAGTCRQLEVLLLDNSQHTALFSFTR